MVITPNTFYITSNIYLSDFGAYLVKLYIATLIMCLKWESIRQLKNSHIYETNNYVKLE